MKFYNFRFVFYLDDELLVNRPQSGCIGKYRIVSATSSSLISTYVGECGHEGNSPLGHRTNEAQLPKDAGIQLEWDKANNQLYFSIDKDLYSIHEDIVYHVADAPMTIYSIAVLPSGIYLSEDNYNKVFKVIDGGPGGSSQVEEFFPSSSDSVFGEFKGYQDSGEFIGLARITDTLFVIGSISR